MPCTLSSSRHSSSITGLSLMSTNREQEQKREGFKGNKFSRQVLHIYPSFSIHLHTPPRTYHKTRRSTVHQGARSSRLQKPLRRSRRRAQETAMRSIPSPSTALLSAGHGLGSRCARNTGHRIQARWIKTMAG